MTQIGICEWSAGAGEEALFQRLQRVGLQGMQVSYESNGFWEKMQRYAAWGTQYGVTLTSVGANVFCEKPLFLPENAALMRETVEDVAKGAALTAGRLFHVPAFGVSHLHTDEDYRRMVTGLRVICDIAAAYDVQVGSENVLSLEENRRLLDEVGRANFGIYFDSQNPQTTAHPDATAQAAAFAGDFFEVHVKDCAENGVSVPLGQGVTAAKETVAALVDGGFDGWYLLENVYNGDTAEQAMAADAAWVRKVVCKS